MDAFVPRDIGVGDQARTASTQSFLTSLSTNSITAGVELALFCAFLLVPSLKAVYQPRTYIPPKNEQAKPLARNIARAFWQMANADPKIILNKNGVDPYLFVRFLRMMVKMLVPIWLISWVVLLPADSVNTVVANKTGLDRFTFGNVSPRRQNRLWAHLCLAYVFNAWIMYLLWEETAKWLKIRQAYLVSPKHKVLAEARTVLITGIPKELMDENALEQLFSPLPGGVKRIWLNRDLKDLPKLWDRRLKACSKLESAEVALLKKAQAQVGAEVPQNQRPTMRLKPSWAPFSLGWLGIGEKVDTITWARNEITTCTQELTVKREALATGIDGGTNSPTDEYPPLSSAFIMFNTQMAAQMARQCLTSDRPYTMSSRYIEQSPRNVIWRNMGIRNNYEANVRMALSYAATAGLMIAWSFPVVFIGALSNIKTLTNQWPWLNWINGNSFGKHLLQGVISGVLPPVLLALLMMLLPVILRQLATLQGRPTKTEVELDVMTRYFVFLVINSFIIITLASGLVAAVQQIAQNPTSVATTLAQNLPTASTFFITRILLQFTGTMGNLLSPITLTLYYVRVILGGGTPRGIFSSRYRMPTIDWGDTFPNVTVYAVIMLSYMIISPIISGFGAAFSLLSYFVYKYQFIWQLDQPKYLDTGGLFFPKAIQHVFVGLYIQEVCLCILFFLARNENGKVSAIPQAALMIVLIIATAAVNAVMNAAYKPLRYSLPLSLSKEAYGTEARGNTPTEDIPPKLAGERPTLRHRSSTHTSIRAPKMEDIELAPMSKSNDTHSDDIEDEEFARPGGAGVLRDYYDDGNDPRAFFHPATKDPQRIIWIPSDVSGLSSTEIQAMHEQGVAATSKHASMATDGRITISGPPPDDTE